MSRTVMTVCVGVSLCALSVGCANFFETRAISQFSDALDQKKLSSLKERTSEEFQQKALRHAEAIEDFEILRLPDGKRSIVSVQDGKSKDEKQIRVEVGKDRKKLLYRLVKNKKTGKWVVDDILVKQKKQGLNSVRSVTEQMDLLLTVREFLDTWDRGKRDKVLAITAPALKSELSQLPEPYLKRLTQQVIGKRSKSKKLRPKAELDGDNAIVTLSRTSGKMVLTFKLIDEKWKVSDLAVEAKLRGKEQGSEIPSVLKTATALRTSLQFLTAYEVADMKTLAKLCTPQLWNESLKFASGKDFATVRLTPEGVGKLDYKMQLRAHRGNFILEGKDEWLQISLMKNKNTQSAGTPTEYLIEEVTIYQLKEKQEVRLSSLFMAKEVLRIFADSLAGHRRDRLRHVSTVEFNNRVWDRADDGFLKQALPAELVSQPLQVVDTKYLGPVTRIQARHGRRHVTYVLRDRGGRVRVDDILIPEPGLPESIRERLELQLPIYRFATALQKNDIPALQRSSSSEFNRLTWKMAKTVPAAGSLAPKYLQAPLTKVTKHGEKTIVLLGSDHYGAKVLLSVEHSRPVINDVLMIAGPENRQRAKLKQLMREQLAGGPQITPVIQQTQHSTYAPQGRSTARTRSEPRTTRQTPLPVATRSEGGSLTASFRPDDSAFRNPPVATFRDNPPTRHATPRDHDRTSIPRPLPKHDIEYLDDDMIDRTPVPSTRQPDATGRNATSPTNVGIPRVEDPFAMEARRDHRDMRSGTGTPGNVDDSGRYRTFGRR